MDQSLQDQSVTEKPKNPGRVAWGKELQRRRRIKKETSSSKSSSESSSESSSKSSSESSSESSFTKYLPWGIAGLCITAIIFKERIMHIFPKSLQSEMSSMEDQKSEALLPTAASRRPIGNPFDQS